MMKSLILEPQKTERIGSDLIRRCLVTKIDDITEVSQEDLWFQFSNDITPPEYDDCDAYLLALLMEAMFENRTIIVRGSVSHELLSNLVEYQAIWHRWLPEVYRIVNMEVEKIRINEIALPGAICAFSGGVDATFSVWRHTQKKNSYRSQTINLCSLVHGFDISLSDNEAFESALKRAGETLNDLNLSLKPIKTNYREISVVNWEHSHGSALVAALSNLKFIASTCILGSTHTYNALLIPWGSSPISDHLLSTGGFRVIHDGSSHSRVDKLQEIHDWNAGVSNLRVCWQGDLNDRNCGACEKCLRTQFCFLANGHAIPNCFPKLDPQKNNLSNLVLNSTGIQEHWQRIYESALKNNISEPWVNQLKVIVYKKKSIIEILFPENSIQKKIIGKVKKLYSILLAFQSSCCPT